MDNINNNDNHSDNHNDNYDYDDNINVTDIMYLFNISQEDFNNIKPILQTIPQINQYNLNIHFFIILSAFIYIHNNKIKGTIVELGCCPGEFTIRISKLLDIYNSDKLYNVYDTFTGLPDFSYEFNQNPNFHFKKNDFDCSISKYTELLENMNIHHMPSIHQTNIAHNTTSDLYPSSISFAIFDSVIYDSILGSFNNIWNKLEPEGLIIINKYNHPYFFGVTEACNTFFTSFTQNNHNTYTYTILYNNYNILIIKKILIDTINNNNNNTNNDTNNNYINDNIKII